jgi:excisionase family DNA binding protein
MIPPAKNGNGDDRLLTVPELSLYLQIPDRTILRLAATGQLPGARIADQWRFKRGVIDKWLALQMDAGDEDLEIEDVPDPAAMPLGDLLEERSVILSFEAKDALQAIEQLAARAFANGYLVDKPWFVGALVEREALSSTAMDGGVAFLHTRQRNAKKIAKPFVIVGRCHRGIDFGAPDKKPTYLFFLLGLKYDRLHLPILGRLARVLKKPEIVRTLRAAPTVTRIRDTLLHEDQRAIADQIERARLAPEKRPAEKKPAEKKSAEKRPAEKRPAEKKPAAKKPAKKPAAKKPAAKKPAAKKPAKA